MLSALAAAGALVFVGGLAVTIAVITLAVVAVAACGARLLRAVGLAPADRQVTFQDHETIEGVVVNRSTDAVIR